MTRDYQLVVLNDCRRIKMQKVSQKYMSVPNTIFLTQQFLEGTSKHAEEFAEEWAWIKMLVELHFYTILIDHLHM